MSQRRPSPSRWPSSAGRGIFLGSVLAAAGVAMTAWGQPVLPRPPQAMAPAPPQDLTSAIDSSFTRALPWRFLGPAGEENGDLDHLAVGPDAVGGDAARTLYAARIDGPPFRLPLSAAGPFAGGRAEDFVSVPSATALVPDPRRPEVLYAAAEHGALLRYDGASEQLRVISVWPRPQGFGAGSAPLYRFAPAFPIFFSAHDRDALYAAGNLLFTSTDGGQSWAAVSPDLTRPRQGPAPRDGVVVAAFESRFEAGVFWTASDNGLVHLSRDFAATWRDVTPPQLPAGARITALVPHPKAPGYVYLSAVEDQAAEPQPWVFRSQDYGATWSLLVRGLPPATRVRTLVVDPERAGLLFAATDTGLFVSLDDGGRWRRWPAAEPVPLIRDLVFAGSSLVAAVEGRGLWILDDLSPLRQLTPDALSQDFFLFSPTRAVRSGAQDPRWAAAGAEPRSDQVTIFYQLGALPVGTEVRLQLLGPGGVRIRTYTTAVGVAGGSRRPPARPGLNRFDWDLRYPPADGSGEPAQRDLWSGGPQALPGSYLVRLAVGSDSTTAQFRVDRDPRVVASPEALRAQFDFLLRIRDEIGHVYRLRRDIERMARLLARAPVEAGAETGLGAGRARAAAALRNLRQGLQGLDLLLGAGAPAGPATEPAGGLAEQLSGLAASVELALDRPTTQQAAVLEELAAEVEAAAQTYERLRGEDLEALNELRRQQGLAELLLPATVEPVAADDESAESEAVEDRLEDGGETVAVEAPAAADLKPEDAPAEDLQETADDEPKEPPQDTSQETPSQELPPALEAQP